MAGAGGRHRGKKMVVVKRRRVAEYPVLVCGHFAAAQVAALDAVADARGTTRSRVLREAVELALSSWQTEIESKSEVKSR